MKTTKLTRLVQVAPEMADEKLSAALRKAGGSILGAANRLGVSQRTMYRIIAKRKQPRELARRLQAGIR